MMRDACPFEIELLDVLGAGRWPDACEGELRDHVEACEECRELVTVAESLVTDRRAEEAGVDVPPSGAVWWRMQMRQERESRAAAEKTVNRVHGGVIALTTLAMFVVIAMTSIPEAAWQWVKSTLPSAEVLASLPHVPSVTAVILLTVLAAVFAPVVIYLAVEKD